MVELWQIKNHDFWCKMEWPAHLIEVYYARLVLELTRL